jgi:hypothetical protein
MLSSLGRSAGFADRSVNYQNTIMSSPFNARNRAQESLAQTQTEAPKKQLEALTTPSPGTKEAPTAAQKVVVQGAPEGSIYSQSFAKKMVEQINRGIMRDRNQEIKEAKQREQTMLSNRPSIETSWARGFGVGKTGGKLSLTGFEDEEDWGNQ